MTQNELSPVKLASSYQLQLFILCALVIFCAGVIYFPSMLFSLGVVLR